MASGSRKKKKRRKGRGASGPKKSGVMLGMRSGFKKAASSVGVGESGSPQKKKGRSVVGTAITVALVAVAAFVLYQRFG